MLYYSDTKSKTAQKRKLQASIQVLAQLLRYCPILQGVSLVGNWVICRDNSTLFLQLHVNLNYSKMKKLTYKNLFPLHLIFEIILLDKILSNHSFSNFN